MTKRQLSHRQRGRIARRRQQLDSRQLKSGWVVGHLGKRVEVLVDAERDIDHPAQLSPTMFRREQVINCHFRANLPTLVVGDHISWQSTADTVAASGAVIERIEPRQSELLRPRPYQEAKPVAANIDGIVLVIALEPMPIASLVDRYLIAAEHAGIEVTIIINKLDLWETLDSQQKQEILSLESLYSALGYPVYRYTCTDAKSPFTTALDTLFQGRCSVLVGQSGTGKSSLINTVTADHTAATGTVSSANTRGRHTTTTARLYPVHPTGAIIDSPGIREFGLWHLPENAIVAGMREFAEFARQCRYRDCDHAHSAGCAVLAAIDDGRINPTRVSSYRQIMASLDNPQQ